MAEQILFNIAEKLIENICSKAVNEVASALGFKTQIDKLNNTINMIKNVLLDAEERQLHSRTVRGWLERLADVVYNADDLFDEFATVASQWEAMDGNKLSKEVRIFFSKSNRIGFALSMSNKIKKIREELDEIHKDCEQFNFVLRHPEERVAVGGQRREQTHSYIDSDEVIGREDDKKAILDIILTTSSAEQMRISVIPIVGIGGMGKTTLAQLIYNDDEVVNQFELRLWVCVSEAFDVKEIVKKILMSAKDVEPQNLEMDQLQGQLRKAISGRKYLLVLDDVWNEDKEEWFKLRNLLNFGREGSKVLVTTRSWKVAQIMKTLCPYGLGVLSEEKSWVLFELKAFEQGEAQEKPHLVTIGKNIVKKCGGIPLAIRTLGASLCDEDERKWLSVEGSSLAELPENNIMAVLKLSYNHLWSPLKSCFAYCSLFPKNFVFQKETLIDMWTAEGFTSPVNKSQNVEEVADEYFEILLRRCFFQDIVKDEWGNIMSCKMHDLMHDLAQIVAGTETKVAENDQDRNFSKGSRHMSFAYRLTSSTKHQSCIQAMVHMRNLRTILLPEQVGDGSYLNSAVLEQIILNFKGLRVLDLHSLGIKSLPNSIGKLIHLRYLDLSYNPVAYLPKSITSLVNLQTLKLSCCNRLRALPINMRKLTNLRTLDLPSSFFLYMPPGIGELTSLHKLTLFTVRGSVSFWERFKTTNKLKDLKNLNNLRGSLKIDIRGEVKDHASEAHEASLSSKHGLTKLKLKFGVVLSKNLDPRLLEEAILEGLKPHSNLRILDIMHYRGHKLPSWVMADELLITLPNLVEITLLDCMSCLQLPSFSQLPFLKRLKLESVRKVEYMESHLSVVESTSQLPETLFFPVLEKLTLLFMDNLKGWWDDKAEMSTDDQQETLHDSGRKYTSISFPKLTKLHIEDCRNVASFPLCPNVEELSLVGVNKKLLLLKQLTSSAISPVSSSAMQSTFSSKLKSLSIDNVEDLISLPAQHLNNLSSLEVQDRKLTSTLRLVKVFKRLSSLRYLCFKGCRSLRSISEGLEYLIGLDTLFLSWCHDLDMSFNGEGLPWKALKTLDYLKIDRLPELVNLPVGLQHLTNLRSLELTSNYNLVGLPEWISCWTSLEQIELSSCPKMKALPESMARLTNLNVLEIRDCPGLTKRCRGPNGADWSKIQHIPLLTVKKGSVD